MAAVGESVLPKESELAIHYGVSLTTIRSAMGELKRKQLVRAIPGKGTFVVPQVEGGRLTLILCGNISHPYTAVATQVILDESRVRGQPATVTVIEEDGDELDWRRIGFSPKDVGGMLTVGQVFSPACVASVRRQGVPVVVLGDLRAPIRAQPVCHQVMADSRAAAYLATRHLLRAGHQRILLACWGGGTAWGAEQARGCQDALAEEGLPYDEALRIDLPSVQFDPATGHYIESLGSLQDRLDATLEAPDAPTAVIHGAALDVQLREMLHIYFHDRFAPAAVVGLSATEIMQRGYSNGEEAWASAMPLRDLVRLALDLLRDADANAAPLRMIVDGHRMWRRDTGGWHVHEEC
jgi:hypothetical protein